MTVQHARLRFHTPLKGASARVALSITIRLETGIQPEAVPGATYLATSAAVDDVRRWFRDRTPEQASHDLRSLNSCLRRLNIVGVSGVAVHADGFLITSEPEPFVLPEAEDTYESGEPHTHPTIVPVPATPTPDQRWREWRAAFIAAGIVLIAWSLWALITSG